MSATVLSFVATAASSTQRTKKESLAVLLGRHGILTISPQLVAAHKQSMLANIRAQNTSLAIIGIALRVVMHASLFRLFGSGRYPRLWGPTVMIGLLLAAILSGIGFGAVSIIPAIPVVCWVFLTLLSFVIGHRTQSMLFSHWDSMPFKDYHSHVPQHVRAIATKTRVIPGLSAQVEYLDDDPFLAVSRGWGPFRETVRVAAWDTGDHYLDGFAKRNP